ncbi:UNVERIFIED_CONTAM: hypothetical protein FKN15_019243 [Acipenser sinensis]
MAVEFPESVRRFCRTRAFWILVASYIGYIILGSAVLMALEMPRETELREQLRTLRATFLDSNQCVQDGVLESFIEKVLFAKKYGVSALDERSLESNYDFTSSLFFVSAFLTTTGYLILGLIGMLLVLETFWELPGIQRFVKIFRSPWETQEGKLTVLPMDDSLSREELAAPAPWEEKNQEEPFYTQSSASYVPDKH